MSLCSRVHLVKHTVIVVPVNLLTLAHYEGTDIVNSFAADFRHRLIHKSPIFGRFLVVEMIDWVMCVTAYRQVCTANVHIALETHMLGGIRCRCDEMCFQFISELSTLETHVLGGIRCMCEEMCFQFISELSTLETHVLGGIRCRCEEMCFQFISELSTLETHVLGGIRCRCDEMCFQFISELSTTDGAWLQLCLSEFQMTEAPT